MSRVTKALSLALAISLTAMAVPAGAQEDEDSGDPGFLQLRPEMRDGTWFGSAIAGGTAVFDADEVVLLSDLEIHGNFYFDVREGEVTGTWDIIPPSAGTIDMTSGGAVAATLDATYTGSGEVTGDRTRVEADAVVTQDGTVRTSSGVNIPADSTDELPSKIAAEVTTAFCNEVYGDWVFSWEQTLQSVGWNPSFDGEWVAVRQSAEFEEQIEGSQVQELTTDIAEAADRWNNNLLPELRDRDHSRPFSDSEWNSMIGLIEELERIQNRLRNLTPCDRETFGDDQVERWLHLMERGVLAIIEGAAGAGQLSGWEIEMLTGIGIRTGGLSALPSDPQFTEDVSELLRQQAEAIVNDYYEVSEDGRYFEVPPGTSDTDDLYWAVRAGERMAWSFTLQEDGHTKTVPASEMAWG